MPTAITYRSYAKINLYLDILNKRRDGFHNIETIFQTVSLADTLRFEDRRSRISLSCSNPELHTGEGNLVFRAAMLLRRRSGCRLGARITVEKRIPLAAGLAGGSGNAAATLIALNVLWDLRWPIGRLLRLGLELGSDVPFCLLGGTMAATRRGEELARLAPLNDTWFVLAHPPIAISASHIYTHPDLGHNPEKPFAGRTPSLRRAIGKLAQGDLPGLIFNRMEPPVFNDYPQLVDLKQRLLDLGCTAAAMSGSGSTIFGLAPDKRTATRIAESISDYRTSVVSTVPLGIERIE